jgi:hypothetical protein
MILGSHSRHRHESIVKLLHRILSGALGLMFGALVRAAERWRGLPFTEFELRQLAANREDLNREYEAAITPPARSSQPRFSSRNVPDPLRTGIDADHLQPRGPHWPPATNTDSCLRGVS